ncbi:MAG: rhomboid family intramembrane serine protease [Gammaproteobacteria bacterium]|nr:rhomboid family intramembrane serine protease [Gammaproteobacteria bacterium]NND61001.1 rhomboid family intramembrane serine protease [Gammaproteobacteria bacterium]
MNDYQPDRQVRAVFQSRSLRAVMDRALVLRATHIRHEVVQLDDWYVLAVSGDDSIEAHEQIRLYEAENRGWPPKLDLMPTLSGGLIGAMIYATLLIVVHLMNLDAAFGFEWQQAGRIDGRLMLNGEWWRSVTALTLHGDVGHLAGNVFFGAIFGVFTARLLGEGLAWSLILAGGILGNITNVLIQHPSHRAVGASTAVFAALGVLTAYTWMHRRDSRFHLAYRAAPLVSGLVLLAYLGTGDARTDIVAHLTGFGWGMVGGMLAANWPRLTEYLQARQAMLGLLAMATVCSAWLFRLY